MKNWFKYLFAVCVVVLLAGCTPPIDSFGPSGAIEPVQAKPNSQPQRQENPLAWQNSLKEFRLAIEVYGKPADEALADWPEPRIVSRPGYDYFMQRQREHLVYGWEYDKRSYMSSVGVMHAGVNVAVKNGRVDAVETSLTYSQVPRIQLAGRPGNAPTVSQIERMLNLGKPSELRYEYMAQYWHVTAYYQLGEAVVEMESLGLTPPVTETSSTNYSTGTQSAKVWANPAFANDYQNYIVGGVYIGPNYEVFTKSYGAPLRKPGKPMPN